MAEVLVVVEAGVKKVSLEMLTIARGLGTVSAVAFGEVDADGYLVAPKAAVIASLVRRVQPAAVLLASTQEGKEIAGRLAVKLDNGLLTDAVGVDAEGVATQVVFAGAAIV